MRRASHHQPALPPPRAPLSAPGVAAARLAADSLLAVMEPRLPHGPPPSPQSPGFLPWREDVQLALVETLAELNKMFAMKVAGGTWQRRINVAAYI